MSIRRVSTNGPPFTERLTRESTRLLSFLLKKARKWTLLEESGKPLWSSPPAGITAGIKDYYYQSSRVVRQSTADLLLKLGATPLAQSGVQTLELFSKER